MTLRSLVFVVCLLGAAVWLMPAWTPRGTEVRMIDEAGRDEPCPPAFATVVEPNRAGPSVMAFWEDFSYAAASAGPVGCAMLGGGVVFVVMLIGLWCRGGHCALRRIFVTIAIAVPLSLGLLYASCFLDGRYFRVGPQGVDWALVGLHAQTDRSTGFLSPKELVEWHYRRGFSVLNVSDKDDIGPALEARRAAERAGYQPRLLVLVGEEWHGGPDVVLIHIRRSFPTGSDMGAVAAEVRREGGATVLAHPWSKLGALTLEDALAKGVDGVEVVNGVIHGGANVIQKARNAGVSMAGVTDYKLGPHVNAATLIPARNAATPAGVVDALRRGRTRVLYAVPGGTMSGDLYDAGTLGTSGAMIGLRTLLETSRDRRAAWIPWLALFALLWWFATRRRGEAIMGVRTARVLLASSVTLLCCLPLGLSWQVRAAVGTIPLNLLLAAGALVAVPLLAASHALARHEDIAAAADAG